MIKYTPRLVGYRKTTAIAVRSIILLLLICLIVDIKPYSLIDRKNVIFVVDRSASTGNQEKIVPFLNEVGKYIDEISMQAILSFGKDVAIDRSFSKLEPFNGFQTVIANDESNISNAIRQAAGMISSQGGGKIVLLSDGYETAGDFVREIGLLQSLKLSVDVLPLEVNIGQDTALSQLKTPSHLKLGEKFQLTISLQSTHETDAKIVVYEDQQLIAEADLFLVKGDNTFLMDHIAKDAGTHQYMAEVITDNDSEPLNNRAHSISKVDGPAGVLIVNGAGNTTNLEEALSASFIQYRSIEVEELSFDLTKYLQYDSIIFNNVSATDIPASKMDLIAQAVRNYGVGFVMLGGDQSFGLGGYFDTPIEKILPVSMDLEGKRQLPKLGLVLVIDHSGSMAGDNIELAKEAAIRTVQFLRPVDTVTVIAFDDRPTIIVPPTLVSEQESIITAISSIQPAGGTSIFPALQEAYNQLDQIRTERKHIILLSDGQSATNDNYKALTDEMIAHNMTLSTVALGDGADSNLLSKLAEDANGRYYFTNDQTTIPTIFSREAVMMSRAYVVEQTMTPSIGYAGSWNQLWSDGIPSMDAYIATSAKDMAEVALYSPLDDPILARWNVGAGKSVAFTSDVNGKWASDWVTWSQFPNILAEWIKWTFPQFVSTPYAVEVEGSKLIISTTDTNVREQLAMNIYEGDLQRTLPLIPLGNGKYEVDSGVLSSGVYFTQIGELSSEQTEEDVEKVENGENTLQNAVSTSFVVPYSKEYELHLDSDQGHEKLTSLAKQSNGRMLSWEDADQIYQFDAVKIKDEYDWSHQLLVLILLLWLLDIANRRLSISWNGIIYRAAKAKAKRQRDSAQSSNTNAKPIINSSVSKLNKAIRSPQKPSSSNGASTQNDGSSSYNQTNEIKPVANSSGMTNRADDANSGVNSKAESKVDATKGEATKGEPNQGESTKSDQLNRLLAAKNRRSKQ